ncbi:methyl-accepting chemotaxis protein [Herbinix hemicellulosilytica]|uniref:methyl-accepting chemotaxis protein n=1 Tax=Herbinix hemicellulosilytica TaxID=1564487 RepID=UPI000CD05257|nr:methyl-accepting chemotaxis protein [Herbinix hemicellulosilytica]
MKILKMDSIRKKIYVLISVTVVTSLLGISVVNYIISKRELNRSNLIILKNAVEATMVEINRNYRYTLDESNWMTEEEAKMLSLSSIGDLTKTSIDGVSGATTEANDATSAATANSIYAQHSIDLGESGYLFVIDSEGNVIYHPFLSDNIYDLKSHDGRYIIHEIIKQAKSGGGTTHYALDEDVSLITDSKLVYSMYFPYWDWIVSAVIYDKELARGSNIIMTYNLIGIVIVLAAALLLSLKITGRIIDPIKTISQKLSEVSEGDLTVDKIHIKTEDEMKLLGDSVNSLVDSLNRIVKMIVTSGERLNKYAAKLKESYGYVSKSTSEVTGAISQMAMQTDEQSRETAEGVDKVILLGENIKETAEASNKIGSVVEKNIKLKELGLKSVRELKDAALENNENTAVIERLVSKMKEYSVDIGKISDIISNIAKQTNLLALNASIEASRAGENGLGFAVVAEEIRKLANETSHAVNDIHEKIGQVQEQTAAVVNFISKNRSGVDRINRSVEKTEEIIGLISDGLQALIEEIKVIVDHNRIINQKKDEILEMLGHISERAQENSANIQEISAAAEEQSATIIDISESISQLYEMVNDLNNLVKEFKVE